MPLFKAVFGLIAYITGGIGVVMAQQAGVLGIPTTWIIGILVTILIAVLTAMGAIIKIAYDTAKKWDAVLSGQSGVEDDSGFISRSQTRHKELQDAHERVYEQLLIQGQLLSELTYSFADIAEELEEDDDIDVDVNLDHIEDLHDRERDKRMGDDEGSSSDD